MTDAKLLCNHFYSYIKDIKRPLWEECNYKGEPINTINLTEVECDTNLCKLNLFTLYKRKHAQKRVKFKDGAVAAWSVKLSGNGVPLTISITFINVDVYNIEVNININYNGECIKVILFIDEDGEVTYKSEYYECDSNTVCRAIKNIIECIRNRIEYIIQDEL